MVDKKYYSISELSKIAGVQPHVLRYWESEFRELRPRKDRAGKRSYSKKDVELVLSIKELLYEELYTVAGAKRQLKQDKTGSKGKATSTFILKEIRDELRAIVKELEK